MIYRHTVFILYKPISDVRPVKIDVFEQCCVIMQVLSKMFDNVLNSDVLFFINTFFYFLVCFFFQHLSTLHKLKL
jgi:hypothetical protein